MTNPSRLVVLTIAPLSLFLIVGCAKSNAGLSAADIFVAKTDGDVQSRFSRIHDLETRLKKRTNVDLGEFRKELIAYCDAVVATADSIVSDPRAADSQKSQAIDYAFKALEQRSEAAPDEALKRLQEQTDLIENQGRGTLIAALGSYHHVKGLIATDDRAFKDSEHRATALDAAVAKLAAATPPHPDSTTLLEQLANRAEKSGDLKRERILYTLLVDEFPEDPAAARAKNILNRINLVGKEVPDFRGVDPKGKVIDLKDLRGRPVVVFYWSDEVDKGMTEMALMVGIISRYEKSDVAFIGINMEGRGAKTVQMAQESKLHWLQIVPPANLASTDAPPELATRFGIESAPYDLLFDREGRLVTFGTDFKAIEPALKTLLQEGNSTPEKSTAAR